MGDFNEVTDGEHDKWGRLYLSVVKNILRKQELAWEDFNTLQNFHRFTMEIVSFWAYPLEYLLKVQSVAEEENWKQTNSCHHINSADAEYFFNQAKNLAFKVNEAAQKKTTELVALKHKKAIQMANTLGEYAKLHNATVDRNMCFLEVREDLKDRVEKSPRDSFQTPIENDARARLDILKIAKNHVAKLILIVLNKQYLLERYLQTIHVNLKYGNSVGREELKDLWESLLQFEISDAENSERCLKSLIESVELFSKLESNRILPKTSSIQTEINNLKGEYTILQFVITCIKNQEKADYTRKCYESSMAKWESSEDSAPIHISCQPPISVEAVAKELIGTADDLVKEIKTMVENVKESISKSNLKKSEQDVLIGHFKNFYDEKQETIFVNSFNLAMKLSVTPVDNETTTGNATASKSSDENDSHELIAMDPIMLLTFGNHMQLMAGPKWNMCLDICKIMLEAYCRLNEVSNDEIIFFIRHLFNIIAQYEKSMAYFSNRKCHVLETCLHKNSDRCPESQLFDNEENARLLAEIEKILCLIRDHAKSVTKVLDPYISTVEKNCPQEKAKGIMVTVKIMREEVFKTVARCIDLLTQLPGNNAPNKELAHFFGVSTQSADEKRENLGQNLKKMEDEDQDEYAALMSTFDAASIKIKSDPDN